LESNKEWKMARFRIYIYKLWNTDIWIKM
jgi:hypothetical protein